MSAPLRYRISDWHQANKCLSNNSRDLWISVTDLLNNDILTGVRIAICHRQFGTLFSTVVKTHGNIISEFAENIDKDISNAAILKEFAKYGFLVDYKPESNLPGSQISYLMSVAGLNFDKIRIMSVYEYDTNGRKHSENYVVAFMSVYNPYWLNANYSCSMKEFKERLASGSVTNLSKVSEQRNFDWSCLYNNIANIDDILNSCSRCCQ